MAAAGLSLPQLTFKMKKPRRAKYCLESSAGGVFCQRCLQLLQPFPLPDETGCAVHHAVQRNVRLMPTEHRDLLRSYGAGDLCVRSICWVGGSPIIYLQRRCGPTGKNQSLQKGIASRPGVGPVKKVLGYQANPGRGRGFASGKKPGDTAAD